MARTVAFVSSFALASSMRRKWVSSSATCGMKGQSGSLAQIVNGEVASDCAWPWQANVWTWQSTLHVRKEAKYHCGGTLIHPEWVLTTRQCVDIGPWGLEVTFGMHNTTQMLMGSAHQQKRRIAEVYKHPNASDFFPYRNDLALLRLEEPVTITSCVSPACLPVSDVTPKTKCWITGFGPTSFDQGVEDDDYSDVLREAEVEVWSNRQCTSWGDWKRNEIDESMICIMGEGRRFIGKEENLAQNCYRDRGGPLVCEDGGKFAVYGAASFNEYCGENGKPGVYARVQPQAAWIRDTMANAPAEKTPVRTCPAGSRTRFPNGWGNCACKETDTPFCYYRGEARCPFQDGGDKRSQDSFAPDCEDCICSATPYTS